MKRPDVWLDRLSLCVMVAALIAFAGTGVVWVLQLPPTPVDTTLQWTAGGTPVTVTLVAASNLSRRVMDSTVVSENTTGLYRSTAGEKPHIYVTTIRESTANVLETCSH